MTTGDGVREPRRILRVRQSAGVGRWLRESPNAVVLLAIGVGALTGCGALVFRWLIEVFTNAVTGFDEYPGDGPSLRFPGLGLWFLVLAPVVTGAIYGPLVYWLAPETRRLGGAKESSNPYADHGAGITSRVTAVKTLGSAITMGGGGSVGREGPMVAIGSAVGSAIGSACRIDSARMRLLIACGAAAGISTAFNAPISGTFFAMEIIIRNYTTRSLGAVMLSSWTAHVIGKAVIGEAPLFPMPVMHADKMTELPVFLLVGLVAGLAGIVFARSVPLVARLCDWVWRGPEWLRPAVGGVLLGLLLLALPEMYGSGYPVLENAIEGHYDLALVLVLLVGKIVATSFTLGIGGLGGVFAPTLFIGAMAGTAFGLIAGEVWTGASSPAVYGLVGMAAAFASAERAALTGVVLIYELTRELTLVVPLALAVAMATLLARLVRIREAEDEIRDVITAAAVAREVPEPIPITSSPAEAAAALARSPHNLLPVVDGEGHYVGCLSSHDLLEARGTRDTLINGLITHPTTVSPNAELREMLDTLAFQGGAPVLGDDGNLVGWLVYEDLLARVYPS